MNRVYVYGVYRVFRGVIGVYMMYIYGVICITGVHRCIYGNAGVQRMYIKDNVIQGMMKVYLAVTRSVPPVVVQVIGGVVGVRAAAVPRPRRPRPGAGRHVVDDSVGVDLMCVCVCVCVVCV
jgi:hypothetical protein